MEVSHDIVQDLFANNYALSAADITNIVTNTQSHDHEHSAGMQYPESGWDEWIHDQFHAGYGAGNLGNPTAVNHTILSGTYAGLVGLLDPVHVASNITFTVRV